MDVLRTLVPALGLVAFLAAGAGAALPPRGLTLVVHSATEAPPLLAPCPPGLLPDGDSCVRLPEENEGAPEAESASNAHHDLHGLWVVYDQIPRRPDRPEDYGAYRYPVPYRPGSVVSGYDLDQPGRAATASPRRRSTGHGAIDLAAPKGTPVRLVALEHQEGDAEVVYVGPLCGTTVVTRHSLREGSALHDYLVLYGHLDAPALGLVDHVGATVRDGDTLGFVGDTGSPGLVHLHLEARRVRDGVDAARVRAATLVDGATSVVCDPRNLLPATAPSVPSPSLGLPLSPASR